MTDLCRISHDWNRSMWHVDFVVHIYSHRCEWRHDISVLNRDTQYFCYINEMSGRSVCVRPKIKPSYRRAEANVCLHPNPLRTWKNLIKFEKKTIKLKKNLNKLEKRGMFLKKIILHFLSNFPLFFFFNCWSIFVNFDNFYVSHFVLYIFITFCLLVYGKHSVSHSEYALCISIWSSHSHIRTSIICWPASCLSASQTV